MNGLHRLEKMLKRFQGKHRSQTGSAGPLGRGFGGRGDVDGIGTRMSVGAMVLVIKQSQRTKTVIDMAVKMMLLIREVSSISPSIWAVAGQVKWPEHKRRARYSWRMTSISLFPELNQSLHSPDALCTSSA